MFSIQTSVIYPEDIGELIDYASAEQEEKRLFPLLFITEAVLLVVYGVYAFYKRGIGHFLSERRKMRKA